MFFKENTEDTDFAQAATENVEYTGYTDNLSAPKAAFCTRCGHAVSGRGRFCGKCGNRLI